MLSICSSALLPAPPPAFNMAQYVLRHADRLQDKPAMVEVDGLAQRTTSYLDLQRNVRRVATGLLEYCAPGDHILLEIGSSSNFPLAFLAAIAADLVPVVVSSQLTPPERAHVRRTVKPKITLRPTHDVQDGGKTLAEDQLLHFLKLPEAPYEMGVPDRPAYIVFTSGTSGKPRAVVHAHRAIWARQMMWKGWYDLQEDDRVMHAGAFNWTYTLGTGLMDPWSVGATAVIQKDGTQPDVMPKLMAESEATIFAAAPGVYRRLLREKLPALPHLRHGLSAGEKLTEEFREDWQSKTGTTIHEAFGMSECSTFISGAPQKPAPSGTLGFAQPGRRVAIIGPEGPVARGTSGIIAIHKSDPGLMLGYLDAPEETAARYQDDWFLTGDIGTMDDAGAITYWGRADDMMNAGGYRVSPIEVENALTTYPLVTEAAACAVQVRTGTKIIAAFYVATDMIDEEELRAYMSTRLAGYKLPRLYVAKDTLPRGANNKLLRRVLRAEWEAANGQA